MRVLHHGQLFALASVWAALRRWGGLGLLVLGVVDSSFIPTLGSLDIFNALLAVRHRDLWWYYALMSTAGSVVGAYLMYRVASKAGMGWLQAKLGKKRIARVNAMLQRWGVAAVVIAAIAPPPFPSSAFFVAAGTLRFPIRRYLAAVLAGRAFRYSLVGWIASHYSRRIIRVLRHPDRYLAITLGITAVLVVLGIAAVLTWQQIGRQIERELQEARDRQAAPNA
jgi:undecaprenyl-diphosphatase